MEPCSQRIFLSWQSIAENLFYYIQTGKVLDSESKKNYNLNSDYLKFIDFVNENKNFIESFNSLPKDIQEELKKDYNKIRENYLTLDEIKCFWQQIFIDSLEVKPANNKAE